MERPHFLKNMKRPPTPGTGLDLTEALGYIMLMRVATREAKQISRAISRPPVT